MATRCRYGDLLLTAAVLAGVEPDHVRCEENAAYLAIISTDNNGFVIDVTTPACPVHEAHLCQNPAYKRSIGIRSRPDAAASSPAAGS
jgi:hypothetical protein